MSCVVSSQKFRQNRQAAHCFMMCAAKQNGLFLTSAQNLNMKLLLLIVLYLPVCSRGGGLYKKHVEEPVAMLVRLSDRTDTQEWDDGAAGTGELRQRLQSLDAAELNVKEEETITATRRRGMKSKSSKSGASELKLLTTKLTFSRPVMKQPEPKRKRIPVALSTHKKALQLCKSGGLFYCNKTNIQVCHYDFAKRAFQNKCVPMAYAQQFLKSRLDYCGKCSSTCDDNNPCTTDSWDQASRKCVFTPIKCSGGARCDPSGGCMSGKKQRELCKRNPPNVYRTCSIRNKRGNSDNLLQLDTPFKQPYIGSDEAMVIDDMYLVMTQKDTGKTATCNDILSLEELSLQYLMVSLIVWICYE
jgi:hypothetical protein